MKRIKRKKYSKRGPSTAVMPRVRGPVPKALVVHLKYVQGGVSSSSNNVIGEYISQGFNTNSIYDPNGTGIGHQPRFHDQWANIYRKYYVRRCTITVRIHNTNTTNDAGGYLFTEHRTTGEPQKLTVTASSAVNVERAQSSNECTVTRFRSPSSGQTYWWSKKFSFVPAFAMHGRDKHDNTGLFGANPIRQTAFDILFNMPQAAGTRSIYIEYDLDYEVCLMDPIMPTQS